MPKFSKDGTKILVPISFDLSNEDPKKRVRCMYMPYPSKNKREINQSYADIYTKYGYKDKYAFIEDVRPIARDAGYTSIWRYAIENEEELKSYYFYD